MEAEVTSETFNEQFSEVANTYGVDFLQWLKGAAIKGEDFLGEQAPLLCQDIINWEFYSHLAWLCVGIVYLLVGLVGIVLIYRWGKSLSWHPGSNDVRELFCVILGVAHLLLVGFGSGNMVANVQPTIKAAVAPRLVIIDYVKQIAAK